MILYNFQKDSSFIKKDREIITKRTKVIDFVFSPKSKVQTPFLFLYQLFFLLNNWNKYQVILSHIAGYHTFIPSILSWLRLKTHIIVLHGTDCNIIPEINYGNLQRPVLKWFTKQSILKASLLLPVSHSLVNNTSEYYLQNNIKLGLTKNIKGFNSPYKVIHNAVDSTKFWIKNTDRAPLTFMTVAFGLEDEKNVKLKGIDLILSFARKNPNYKITILGSSTIFSYENNLENVTINPKVNHEEIIDYYNKNKYYIQLSISESFGLSLCEAMLCGCIPIVSRAGMMAEIIEDKGFILERRDEYLFNELVKNIVNTKTAFDIIEIRNLIVSKYSLNKRSEELMKIMNHYLATDKTPR